jgi:predicted membrane protein
MFIHKTIIKLSTICFFLSLHHFSHFPPSLNYDIQRSNNNNNNGKTIELSSFIVWQVSVCVCVRHRLRFSVDWKNAFCPVLLLIVRYKFEILFQLPEMGHK